MRRLPGFAILGAGRMGAVHAQTLLALPNARLVAVLDPDQEAAIRIAEDRLAATRLDAAFKNPEVDAVLIASPTHVHVEHIIAAARAGKAIFCEEPVSLDLARAEEAMRVVEETQVPFQIGFQRRYDPGFAEAHRRLGALGRLEMLRIQSCDSRALADRGGAYCHTAIQDIDLARFYAGDIIEVTATGARADACATDDPETSILTLRFASGAVGVIGHSRRPVHGCGVQAELFGDQGRLVVEQEHAAPVHVYDAGGVRHAHLAGVARFQCAYVNEVSDFVDAVYGGQIPTPGVKDAIESLRVALAATRSLHEGRPVRIDEMQAGAPASDGEPVRRRGRKKVAPV